MRRWPTEGCVAVGEERWRGNANWSETYMDGEWADKQFWVLGIKYDSRSSKSSRKFKQKQKKNLLRVLHFNWVIKMRCISNMDQAKTHTQRRGLEAFGMVFKGWHTFQESHVWRWVASNCQTNWRRLALTACTPALCHLLPAIGKLQRFNLPPSVKSRYGY